MAIRNKTLDWIKNLLYNRQQCVAIDAERSLSGPVVLGIRQGLVIALVLFVIYVKRLRLSCLKEFGKCYVLRLKRSDILFFFV